MENDLWALMLALGEEARELVELLMQNEDEKRF
jgi:hypothetical protein